MDMRRSNQKAFTGEEICNKLVEAQKELGNPAPQYQSRNQFEKQAWDKIAEWFENECFRRFTDGRNAGIEAAKKTAEEEAKKVVDGG